MDKRTSGEEGSSSGSRLAVKEAYIKKMQRRIAMTKAYEANLERIRDGLVGLKNEADITKFEPPKERFGDDLGPCKISASKFHRSVASIALFHDEVMVFACSATAVRLRHGYIQDRHKIFVTSARFAHEFNANRTKDDKLRIELRIPNNVNPTMNGYLGLHDENIAIVTSFCPRALHTMETSNPADLPPGRGNHNNKLFAFGCADDCTLMGTSCSYPVFHENGFVSVNCDSITATALGGAVICFGHDRSGHLAGVIVGCSEGKTTFIPTKMLHELLHALVITSKTSVFRGYSLPQGVKSVIPSGFMVRSTILQSLGYPLPPPLVFELNGGLVGTFENDFGQFHYWEGFPFDDPYSGPGKPIWEQLGEQVIEKMSKSVVSIASFKEHERFFACTGLLITWGPSTFVLTSASLVRTGDAPDEIDENLRFEVFLPPGQCVDGMLELYHSNYNIAIFSLGKDLSDISPVDILSAKVTCPRNKVVAAIGRRTKERHGLLMASMGKVTCTINCRPKKKEHQGLDLNCKDLVLSTCKIKKVGIGGPLIGLDGKFMGMNFYDESRTTPFMPSTKIAEVMKKGFKLLFERDSSGPPIKNMETPTRKMERPTKNRKKRNQWPVPKPYWYLAGQQDVLDQHWGNVSLKTKHGGKVSFKRKHGVVKVRGKVLT